MKTPEELASIRREVEALNMKLSELTDEELAQVAGGKPDLIIRPDTIPYTKHDTTLPISTFAK